MLPAYNLQQVADCEKFVDKSWLRLWSEFLGILEAVTVHRDQALGPGSCQGAARIGSCDCAVGAGSSESA